MYYLQSRYYDPLIGRFLNADAFTSTGQGLLGNNMFAYCNNNPVNYLDPTGIASIWYYLIIDSDMGFIHRMVVNHIRSNYAVKTEVVLSSIGRADVVHEGLVWEVKHAGANWINRTTEAWAQAFTYQIFNNEITGLGAAGAFDGYFYIGCEGNAYLVSYDTPASGAILYTVSPVQNYTGQYYASFIPSTNKQEEIEQGLQLVMVGGGCMLVAGCLSGGGHSSYDTKNTIF